MVSVPLAPKCAPNTTTGAPGHAAVRDRPAIAGGSSACSGLTPWPTKPMGVPWDACAKHFAPLSLARSKKQCRPPSFGFAE